MEPGRGRRHVVPMRYELVAPHPLTILATAEEQAIAPLLL